MALGYTTTTTFDMCVKAALKRLKSAGHNSFSPLLPSFQAEKHFQRCLPFPWNNSEHQPISCLDRLPSKKYLCHLQNRCCCPVRSIHSLIYSFLSFLIRYSPAPCSLSRPSPPAPQTLIVHRRWEKLVIIRRDNSRDLPVAAE